MRLGAQAGPSLASSEASIGRSRPEMFSSHFKLLAESGGTSSVQHRMMPRSDTRFASRAQSNPQVQSEMFSSHFKPLANSGGTSSWNLFLVAASMRLKCHCAILHKPDLQGFETIAILALGSA